MTRQDQEPSNASPLDTELMLQTREGDASAFEQIYSRHYRKVLNFFFAMSRDAGLAEDLCHETFLRIWKFRGRYAATGPFVAYLFAFARNIWFEKRRSLSRFAMQGYRVAQSEWDECADSGPLGNPADALDRAELGEAIERAIDGLPDDQRMAFVLRTVEGLSLEEIAAVMMCPVNTVRSRRILAVRKLRSSLRRLFASRVSSHSKVL
ncbi:MAG TPA: RNA polymerase sigma factor [Candidatus Hydrogenedentes bacterium]|nr:RNA polymerase sigma factor [Candidatus Hydrogenedentota bacterium]HOS03750.1 RNA polymerase sigma factor [Candidatus Hydrogenedentota bacterium]